MQGAGAAPSAVDPSLLRPACAAPRLPGLRAVHGARSACLAPAPPPRGPEDVCPPSPTCRMELAPPGCWWAIPNRLCIGPSPVAAGADADDCRAACERLGAVGVSCVVCLQEPRELATTALSCHGAAHDRGSTRSSTRSSAHSGSPRSPPHHSGGAPVNARTYCQRGGWADCVAAGAAIRGRPAAFPDPTATGGWTQHGLLLAGGEVLLINDLADGLHTPTTVTPSHRSSRLATPRASAFPTSGPSPGVAQLRRYLAIVQSLSAPCAFHPVPIPDGGTLEDEHVTALVDDLCERLFHQKEVLYLHSGDDIGRPFAVAALVLGAAYDLSAQQAIDYLFRCMAMPLEEGMRPATASTLSTEGSLALSMGRSLSVLSGPAPPPAPGPAGLDLGPDHGAEINIVSELLAQAERSMPSVCTRNQLAQVLRLLDTKRDAFACRAHSSGENVAGGAEQPPTPADSEGSEATTDVTATSAASSQQGSQESDAW